MRSLISIFSGFIRTHRNDGGLMLCPTCGHHTERGETYCMACDYPLEAPLLPARIPVQYPSFSTGPYKTKRPKLNEEIVHRLIEKIEVEADDLSLK